MTFKIISLNLWWGGKLLPGILDFLRAEDADVLALQEVYDGREPGLDDRYRSVQVLRAALPYQYLAYAQAFIHDSSVGKLPNGNAVFSKFPIIARSARFLTKPSREVYQDVAEQWPIFPRVLQQVQLDTPAGELNVFNMHGVWDIDGDNPSPARLKMSEIIINGTKDKPSVVLTGDTNAKPTNPAMRAIEAHLNSVFDDRLKSTFNMRRKTNPGYATAAVDLMYVSPNIRVISAECPTVDISDHLPLVVSLDIA